MKKGSKINMVEIKNTGTINVFDQKGELLKLSRTQRNALADYKNPNYKEKIIKVFDVLEPLMEHITIRIENKDGEVKEIVK